MPHPLRQTQAEYQQQLTNLAANDKHLQAALDSNKKRRAEIETAKAVVDEAVAKLPPESKPSAPADQKPAPNKSAEKS